jgi:hypothetical protein
MLLICSPVALCLPSRFGAGTWHEEALYRLEVQNVSVLILLGGFFLPSVAPASQQNF